MNLKDKKLIVSIVLSLTLISSASPAMAIEISYPQVPGAETPDVFMKKIEEGIYEKAHAFPLYFLYIYHLMITLSGIVCFISILIGGLTYLISNLTGAGSVQTIQDALERISVGILGISITLASYILLKTLDPQLLVFKIEAPEIEKVDITRMAELTEEPLVFAEIPLGKLLERLETAAGTAQYWSYQLWYETEEMVANNNHTSLKELALCLTDIVENHKIMLANSKNNPSDKIIRKSCGNIEFSGNLNSVIQTASTELAAINGNISQIKAKVQLAKENLEYSKHRLELAEVLMRESVTSPINYDNYLSLEERKAGKTKARKLWIYEDMPLDLTEDPSGLPIPPRRCSRDKEENLVPSCTKCGYTLYCYGNAFRVCSTDPKIPEVLSGEGGASYWTAESDEFPSGTVLYNEISFPVPKEGVYVCDSNIYGCGAAECAGQSISGLKDDPSTFYIEVKPNQDIIKQVEDILSSPLPLIEPIDPINPDDYTNGNGDYPYNYPPRDINEIPGLVEKLTTLQNGVDLQKAAKNAEEKTGVRAGLILAMLYHESGLEQFPGSGNYPDDFCCNVSEWWQSNNCDKFVAIWNEVGHLYPQYTMNSIPVSAEGYYGGVHNCGGAMGPAQFMPFSWKTYKTEIELLLGKPPSPWEYESSFIAAALHLRDRGGADSQNCEDEKAAICNYWGDPGCQDYNKYAVSILQISNGIAKFKTDKGETGWHYCQGEGYENGNGNGDIIPGGDWNIPIRSPTVLSSTAPMHVNRGSVCAWDFTAECGRPIYPAKPGRVTLVRDGTAYDPTCSLQKDEYGNYHNGYGCWVVVDHGAGWQTYYCHMAPGSIEVSVGQRVEENTVLGKVGCTGTTSFGPHTHFEVRGPYSSSGCPKGRIDPKEIFGHWDDIGLPCSDFCYNHACPGCGDPRNNSCFTQGTGRCEGIPNK